MANAFIQVPPQSTGLKVQTFENTVGANVVESEAVTLVRSSDNTEVGTSGQPLRIDPTGTTAQPVTIGANVGVTQQTTPWVDNLTQVAGTTLGATAVVNYGTTPAAAAVPGVNAFVTNSVTVAQATAASLNATVVGTGTFAVQEATLDGCISASKVNVNISSGTVAATQSGTWSIAPATSGGCSIFHLVAAGSTNANNVKASAGQVFGWTVYNNAAYPIYLKFYNTAGTPTPGTGVVRTVGVQAGTQTTYAQPMGIAFATGIGISITKGIADADATAVVASDCVVDVEFK